MYDDPGFIILMTISALAICSAFSALFWAAIQDGRDELAGRQAAAAH